jgi:hypothetical protein
MVVSKMKYETGKVFKFKMANVNEGVMTIHEAGKSVRVLHRVDGTPLKAGELVAGEVVTINRLTGEVLKTHKPKRKRP